MLSPADDGSRQPSVNATSGLKKMSQFILTALFALAISFLTFAASFADVPRSEVLDIQTHE
jgi:hypothetical protein